MVAADATLLGTERLLLVPLDSYRVEELAAVYADPEVTRYIGGERLTAARMRTRSPRSSGSGELMGTARVPWWNGPRSS